MHSVELKYAPLLGISHVRLGPYPRIVQTTTRRIPGHKGFICIYFLQRHESYVVITIEYTITTEHPATILTIYLQTPFTKPEPLTHFERTNSPIKYYPVCTYIYCPCLTSPWFSSQTFIRKGSNPIK